MNSSCDPVCELMGGICFDKNHLGEAIEPKCFFPENQEKGKKVLLPTIIAFCNMLHHQRLAQRGQICNFLVDIKF